VSRAPPNLDDDTWASLAQRGDALHRLERILLAAVFYIEQSGIIFGTVGTGRDISRPTNRRSGLSADVGIGLVERVDFAENSLYLHGSTTACRTCASNLKQLINSLACAIATLHQILLTKGIQHLLNRFSILLRSRGHPIPLPAFLTLDCLKYIVPHSATAI